MSSIILPRVAWAEAIEQRSLLFAREEARHSAISSGHYLYGLLTGPDHELSSRRFRDVTRFDSKTVAAIVMRSQPRTAVGSMVLEEFTDSGRRMMEIVNKIAEDRQLHNEHERTARVTPYDFVAGVLLSKDPAVEEILHLYGRSAEGVLEQLLIATPESLKIMLIER